MAHISLQTMRSYLSKSISSINKNKLNGILAEIDFRHYLSEIGFGNQVSQGGWIVRSEGLGNFAHHTDVFFPSTILPDHEYTEESLGEPPRALHTICATMHQIGIKSHYCNPIIQNNEQPSSIQWYSIQLGIPYKDSYHKFPNLGGEYNLRERRYNFLRYSSDSSLIPEISVPEQFSKEHLRVTFQNEYFCELSDIDGIFWGERYTYPLEIKEKTVADNPRTGEFFGLDVGPFVKLAFYAAKKGNLHSLFIVREIDDIDERNLVGWWFITFDRLAQFASWVPMGGGTNMQGGRSSVIRIPKTEFLPLDKENLDQL